jgi:hypothetical protein
VTGPCLFSPSERMKRRRGSGGAFAGNETADEKRAGVAPNCDVSFGTASKLTLIYREHFSLGSAAMSSHADVQDKPACPSCRGQGAATGVTMRNYQRTISYVCGTCMKTWTATDQVPLDLIGEERRPSR